VTGAVCMTEPDAAALRRYCAAADAHVVNTGVDLDYFRPPEAPAEEARLVFVGAFQHMPNVDAMVYFCREILPLVRARVPGASLTIVGSKPSPEIFALADIPGVEVTGFVTDIRPHMARSAVYVVPLRLGVGIRGKILEAWAMGLPVVATSVACAGLRCEHGGNILVADLPGPFAAHVAALLQNPAEGARLGSEGRRTAEEFYGWDASAGLLDALYRTMMAGGR
jgi:polysaccharide biosynthesis protein PslH